MQIFVGDELESQRRLTTWKYISVVPPVLALMY